MALITPMSCMECPRLGILQINMTHNHYPWRSFGLTVFGDCPYIRYIHYLWMDFAMLIPIYLINYICTRWGITGTFEKPIGNNIIVLFFT